MSTGVRLGFPVAGDGYWAEVVVGDEHLRLFAEVYSLGFLAFVYDVRRHQKLSPEDAAGYLLYRGAGTLPTVHWTLNAQESSRATVMAKTNLAPNHSKKNHQRVGTKDLVFFAFTALGTLWGLATGYRFSTRPIIETFKLPNVAGLARLL